MASKLTSADIIPIGIQEDADSIPLDDNYTNLTNKINEVIDDLAAVSIGTTNAETTAARPYHISLKERLDSIGSGQETLFPGRKNYLKYGGVVSKNSANLIEVTAGEAKVNGIDIKWSAATSGVISAAAANKHRVDVIAAQSDSTIIIVTGSETDDTTTDPIFPSIATTRMSLGCIYVDDTGIVGDAYTLKEDNYLPNYYIKQATTLNQGKYNFNNLIIDNTLTIDCTSSSGFYVINRGYIIIKCIGNFYVANSGALSIPDSLSITNSNANNGSNGVNQNGGAGGVAGLVTTDHMSYSVGYGGVGATAGVGAGQENSGGGGGGGASMFAAGGDGGDGLIAGAGADNDGAGGAQNVTNNPAIFILAYNMTFQADFKNNGGVGGDGADGTVVDLRRGGGGAGGNAGGIMMLISNNDITIDSGVTVSCDGGVGGAGGDASGGSTANKSGGGGGGGAGGLLLIRSLSYTNNGTAQAAGGAGGSAGSSSGPGSGDGANGDAGSAGIVDQALYNNLATSLIDNIIPLNILGLDF